MLCKVARCQIHYSLLTASCPNIGTSITIIQLTPFFFAFGFFYYVHHFVHVFFHMLITNFLSQSFFFGFLIINHETSLNYGSNK